MFLKSATLQDWPRLVLWYSPLMSLTVYSSLELKGLKLGEKNAPPPPGPRLDHCVTTESNCRTSRRSMAISGSRRIE